jgi:hypothetical protein
MRLRLRIESHQEGRPLDEWQMMEGASGLEAFVHHLEDCVNLMWEKNQQYEGAWREQGWMGNLARILSKSARLKAMLWNDMPRNRTDESVEDTARDLVNLCVFFLMNAGQENRWGRRGPE